MTRRYRLPIRLRHPNALRHAVYGVLILLAVYGLYYSITTARAHFELVSQAEVRIALAEAAQHDLEAILSGKLVMVERIEGGEHLAKVATVSWQLVKEDVK